MTVLFIYLSVIVLPAGEVRHHVTALHECPPRPYVEEYHRAMLASGDIVDWAATCTKVELALTIPKGA